MQRSCDAKRYREYAAYFRDRAAMVTDDQQLRDSYLGLAIEYERLAEILERIAMPSNLVSSIAEVASTAI